MVYKSINNFIYNQDKNEEGNKVELLVPQCQSFLFPKRISSASSTSLFLSMQSRSHQEPHTKAAAVVVRVPGDAKRRPHEISGAAETAAPHDAGVP